MTWEAAEDSEFLGSAQLSQIGYFCQAQIWGATSSVLSILHMHDYNTQWTTIIDWGTNEGSWMIVLNYRFDYDSKCDLNLK